jgi:hypothetical protein
VAINARIGFVLMIPTLMVCATFEERKQSAEPLRPAASFLVSPPNRKAAAERTTAIQNPEVQQDGQDDEVGAVDLYGNDVTSAVATYKLDAEGSLYELHSPQTELPRLGSPKS